MGLWQARRATLKVPRTWISSMICANAPTKNKLFGLFFVLLSDDVFFCLCGCGRSVIGPCGWMYD